MRTFYVKRCKKNNLHYVVSLDKSFLKLADRSCPFCKSFFQDTIIDILEDGTPKIGFDEKEVKEALEKNGLYFAKVEIIFSEK